MLSEICAKWLQSVRVGLRTSVAKNVASLYLIHFANYLVPLIAVPYLVRALGPAGYGTVAFGQGLINYLLLFVEYGFDWSATRKISVARANSSVVNRIATQVWIAKGLFSVICFIILLALIAIVPKLKEVALFLVVLYGLVLGNALFPTWLFQGMERMVAISLINLSMKIFVLLAVFGLIRRPEDSPLYAALIGGSSVLAGFTGIVVAVRMFRLKPRKVRVTEIVEVIREGWILFLSRASVTLYTTGNAFILGLLTDHTVVGYYSSAEKLTKSILGLLTPISQAVYPRFSKLASESKERAVLWGRRMLFLMGGIGVLLTALVMLGAPIIVAIMLGPQYIPSVAVMRILAPIIFLIALSNVLGIQIMLPLGKDKPFTLILFCAGILNALWAIILAPIWRATGMAVAVVISELFVTVSMLIYLRVKGVL